VARQRAGHLESPGFELNDLGVLSSADDIDVAANVRRIETTPGERVFAWDVGAGASTSWNFGGLRKPIDLRALGDITSTAFNSASIAFDVTTPGGFRRSHTRRPGDADRLGRVGDARASTPRGRAQQLSGTLVGQLSPTLQQGVVASAAWPPRATSALRLDVTPSLTWPGPSASTSRR